MRIPRRNEFCEFLGRIRVKSSLDFERTMRADYNTLVKISPF